MKIVEVSIRGNKHNLMCKEGEENHLQSLAKKFNDQIGMLSQSLAHVDDQTLYVIAGLTLVDKIEELEVSKKNSILRPCNNGIPISKDIDMVTEKLEKLVAKLERYDI